MITKVLFVEVLFPAKTFPRQAREKGFVLAESIPPDQPLYIYRLKDEGLMFYYSRPVHRLRTPEEWDAKSSAWLVLNERDWQERHRFGSFEVIRWMQDQQGDPIVLVKK